MKGAIKIKGEPGFIDMKKEDITSETLSDQCERSANLVSNIPLSFNKFSSNSVLLVKPEFSEFVDDNGVKLKVEDDNIDNELGDDQFVDDNGIKLKVEDESLDDELSDDQFVDDNGIKLKVEDNCLDDELSDNQFVDDNRIKLKVECDSLDDELSDDQFIETCVKSERQIEYSYKKCDNTIKDVVIRDDRNAYVKKDIVKFEGDEEIEEDNINVEDLDDEENIAIKENIKSEDIEVVEHKIGFQINEDCSVEDNKRIKKSGFNQRKTFCCKYCTYETRILHDLKKHFTLHEDPSKVTLYFCTKCNYKTKQKCHLKRHDLVHQISNGDVLCFRCNMCEFMTKQQCTLQRHIQTVHLKMKRIKDRKGKIRPKFSCAKCSYSTYTKGLLISHMDKHKDSHDINSLYVCNICSFSTKYRRNLRVHLEIHNESPKSENNQCKICNFKTRLPYCLRRHLLSKKHLLAVGKTDQYCPRTLKS